MTGFFARYLIVALVVLGIVMPQTSAALAGLGLADGRMMVICTGDGLRTIRINDDGEPVEVTQDAEICALVHAADTSAEASPGAALPLLRYEMAQALPAATIRAAQSLSPSLPRGPPRG